MAIFVLVDWKIIAFVSPVTIIYTGLWEKTQTQCFVREMLQWPKLSALCCLSCISSAAFMGIMLNWNFVKTKKKCCGEQS